MTSYEPDLLQEVGLTAQEQGEEKERERVLL
jgi:hypothetical protein